MAPATLVCIQALICCLTTVWADQPLAEGGFNGEDFYKNRKRQRQNTESHSSDLFGGVLPGSVNGTRRRTYADENLDQLEEQNIEQCLYSFTAAANLRGELFFFRGKDFWRSSEKNGAEKTRMSSFWKNYDGGNVDAAFQWPSNQYIVFISGDKYWVYSDPPNVEKRSAPIEDFGLHGVDRVDAAVVWNANKRVYLFSGDEFWKLDENLFPDIGYPKKISELPGVPKGLDAAVEDFHGKIHFLKGQRSWNWDDDLLGVNGNNSDFIGSKWFGCNRTVYGMATESNSISRSQSKSNRAVSCLGWPTGLRGLAVVTWVILVRRK